MSELKDFLVKKGTSRRDFIKYAAAAGAGVLASVYMKPVIRSVGVRPAYAQGTAYTPEGCTPGYWKNHTDWWAGTPYKSGDDFDTVFSVNAFDPDRTLLVALMTGGGGVDALGRHAVAALLNATYPDVQHFIYSEAQVKSMVQSALADGSPETIENTKNAFALANESSCTLSGYSLRADP